jgi:hypothetical protein
MTDAEGTYSKLVEIAGQRPRPTRSPAHAQPPAQPSPVERPKEDLSTTPYMSQNYRFTEEELHWIRKQSYDLTERLGAKVSQNTVLRIALQFLRDACAKNSTSNPLVETASRLKK